MAGREGDAGPDRLRQKILAVQPIGKAGPDMDASLRLHPGEMPTGPLPQGPAHGLVSGTVLARQVLYVPRELGLLQELMQDPLVQAGSIGVDALLDTQQTPDHRGRCRDSRDADGWKDQLGEALHVDDLPGAVHGLEGRRRRSREADLVGIILLDDGNALSPG